MPYQERGQCHCANVHITLTLPEPLHTFSPRTCDCDFCTQRNATYLSHPDASLDITTTRLPLHTQRQGSEQAVFYTCPECETLIAVTCAFGTQTKGAINASVLHNAAQLQPSLIVSPQKLSADEKLSRWEQVWMNVYTRM